MQGTVAAQVRRLHGTNAADLLRMSGQCGPATVAGEIGVGKVRAVGDNDSQQRVACRPAKMARAKRIEHVWKGVVGAKAGKRRLSASRKKTKWGRGG